MRQIRVNDGFSIAAEGIMPAVQQIMDTVSTIQQKRGKNV
jgi:hypothetical protein